MYQVIENENYNLYLIKTDKFKTAQITFRFTDLLNRDEATLRSILPHVLRSGTKTYPSKKAISMRLEGLYGSMITASTTKVGCASLVTFTFKIPAVEYIKEENFINDVVDLAYELLDEPYLEDGHFSNKLVKDEIQILKEELLSVEDEPRKKAYNEFNAIMFKNEKYGLVVSGYLDDLKNVNSCNLYDYYKRFLQTNKLDIIICASTPDLISKVIETKFTFKHSKKNISLIDKEIPYFKLKNEVVIKDVNQGILWMGYRSNIYRDSKNYYSMLLLNLLLGVYPHSLLFTNVREKNSLCYSISSRYDAYKGVLVINSGISFDKYEQVVNIIEEQIKVIEKGQIDQLLEMTKVAFKNNYLESLDNQSQMMSKAYTEIVLNEKITTDELFELIDNIKVSDLQECVKTLQLDTIYFLRGDYNAKN